MDGRTVEIVNSWMAGLDELLRLLTAECQRLMNTQIANSWMAGAY